MKKTLLFIGIAFLYISCYSQGVTSGGGISAATARNIVNDSIDALRPQIDSLLGVGQFAIDSASIQSTLRDDMNDTATASEARTQILIDLKADKMFTFRTCNASDTLDLTDADKIVLTNVAGANNITVRTNANVAFSVGTQITILQYGAGQTTIVAEGGVTINSYGSVLTLAGQYASATLIKLDTDTWIAVGKLE